jgi:hypothetical protein
MAKMDETPIYIIDDGDGYYGLDYQNGEGRAVAVVVRAEGPIEGDTE